MFVDLRIEQALAATLGFLAIALVLVNVGHEAIVEADFTSSARVEGAACVEISARNNQPTALHGFEGGL